MQYLKNQRFFTYSEIKNTFKIIFQIWANKRDFTKKQEKSLNFDQNQQKFLEKTKKTQEK